MLSTRYDKATLHLRNSELANRKSFSTRRTSEKSWMHQIAGYKSTIEWHCGLDDHSSFDHTIVRINSGLVISPKKCRSLGKGKTIYLADRSLEVHYDKEKPIAITDGPTKSTNRIYCNGKRWITSDAFRPLFRRTTLKVKMPIVKVLSDSAQVLPCALEELVCESTSLDP